MARTTGLWWRIDDEHPDVWDWEGFPSPRHRFDPPSGRFRVRYATNHPAAAARERFASRVICELDGGRWLVTLRADGAALPLTWQVNLDALGFDDRINTGRIDGPSASGDVLTAGQELSDAVHHWWHGAPPAILYRTRSHPSARSLAFTESAGLEVVSARPLAEATLLLAGLVARHGFVVPDRWLQ